MVSNSAIPSSPITSTSSVSRLRWTRTLSMTTWKNSGETSANSCRKKEANSTSASCRRYLWMAPRNQVMSKRRERSIRPARRVIRTRRPSQTASRSLRVISSGRGDARGLHHDLAVADLAEQQKAAVLERRYGRQGRGRQARPARFHLARLEAELLGASDHVRRADRRRAALVANLRRIGPDAVEAQQHDQGHEPWIILPGHLRHRDSHVPVAWASSNTRNTESAGLGPLVASRGRPQGPNRGQD